MVLSKDRITGLRVGIVAVAVVAVLLQFGVIPTTAARYAGQYPEYEYLALPYTVAIGVAIGLVEFALLAAWQVLSAASAETAPRRQRAWSAVFTLALVAACLVAAGVFVHAGSVAQVGGPPMLFGLLTALAVAAGAVALRRRTADLAVEHR